MGIAAANRRPLSGARPSGAAPHLPQHPGRCFGCYLVAPVTPDIGMTDYGVIAVPVTAVITRPITIAISRVAVTIAVTGIAIGWALNRHARTQSAARSASAVVA